MGAARRRSRQEFRFRELADANIHGVTGVLMSTQLCDGCAGDADFEGAILHSCAGSQL